MGARLFFLCFFFYPFLGIGTAPVNMVVVYAYFGTMALTPLSYPRPPPKRRDRGRTSSDPVQGGWTEVCESPSPVSYSQHSGLAVCSQTRVLLIACCLAPGFWNVSLYVLGWGKRKFNADKNPTVRQLDINLVHPTRGFQPFTALRVPRAVPYVVHAGRALIDAWDPML